MRLTLRLLAPVLLAATVGLIAHAPAPARADREPRLAAPRISQEVAMLFAHRARTGETFPTFRRSEHFEQTGELPIVLRWLGRPDEATRARLSSSGVRFERAQPIASGAWLASITEEGLRALEGERDLARVTVDLFRRAPAPLDASAEETGVSAARRSAIAKDGVPLDGKGVIIADIDTPLFIHHPAFFHADGGAFAWVDVDGDGKLTPGTDGVDLDASGTIEPAEVLREIRSTAVTLVKSEIIEEHSSFAPDIDYLFLDTNGNGKRDYGEGFEESTPAYGEPLFVFDDANRDGIPQPSERVLRLQTSKIKALSSDDETFTRGKSGTTGLNAYAADRDPEMSKRSSHATAVAGILAGGQPGISRWLGLAPAAELVFHDTTSKRGLVSAVQWAIDQKANVILTEYAPYSNVSLDGSSEEETILDAAHDHDVVCVSPAGNLAAGRKHRTVVLPQGATKIPLATKLPAHYAMLSVHHRGAARTIDLSLAFPDGSTIAIPQSAPAGVQIGKGVFLYVTAATTPRGTHERFATIVSTDPLPQGAYDLTATLDAGPPLEVELFAGDDVTSWAGGLTFDQNTPSRTICNPATSDTTLSVAAYVLHEEAPFEPQGARGAIPSYSSRGPLLDGTPGIELAAPHNPISTAPPNPKVDGLAWAPFGGTSGAGPHVAAGVALMRQALPDASAATLRKRLLDAVKPGEGGEEVTGKGKLDVAKALDATVPSGPAPVVRLERVGPAVAGAEATLLVAADDDEPSGLTARWDLEYDGTFDTEWLPLGEQKISLADAVVGDQHGVRVEVRDSQGNVAGASATLDVVAPAEVASSATAAPAEDAGCLCRTGGGGGAPARGPVALALTLAAVLVVRARSRARA